MLSTSPRDLPTPGFDVNGWYLVTQAHVLTTLKPATVDLLIHVYNRMRTCNDVLEQLGDITYGPTAFQYAATLAGASDHHGVIIGPVATLRDAFEAHHSTQREGFVSRLDDLNPLLDRAIDAVEEGHRNL